MTTSLNSSPEGVPSVPDHELLRRIGRGAYGEVWLARNSMGCYRAVKVVFRDEPTQEEHYAREMSGIKRFEPLSRRHEGFVDLLQVGFSPDGRYFYCVMELADDVRTGQDIRPDDYQQRTLASEIAGNRRLSVQHAIEVGLSLAAGLEYLHDHRFVHRDLKPSNVVFVEGRAKIADIGLVADMGGSHSLVGTPGYMPPEGPGTASADIYAFGKVIYEAATGCDRQNYPALPDTFDQLPDRVAFLELNEIILKACKANPKERYQRMTEIVSELRLLTAGRSVRRLRTLERWLRIGRGWLIAAGVAVAAVSLFYYEARMDSERKARQLASSLSSFGARAVNEGDLLESLTWYTAALQSSAHDNTMQQRYRRQIALVLRRAPRLVDAHFYGQAINDVRFSADGRRWVAAGAHSVAELVDALSNRPIVRLHHLSQPGLLDTSGAEFESVRFYARDWLVTGGTDRTLRFWNVRDGTEVADWRLVHPGKVFAVDVSPDGRRVATGCWDGALRLWEVGRSNLLAVVTNHTETVRWVTFSANGRQVLTAGRDGRVVLCDGFTGQPLHPPIRHTSWVFEARFNPQQTLFVSACADRVARLWNAKTCQPAGEFRHRSAVRSATFNPDGRLLATACWDNTVRVWDIESGREVIPPLWHEANPFRIEFSPDGRRLLTACASGLVRLWDLAPVDQWAAEADRATDFMAPLGFRVSADGRTCVKMSSGGLEFFEDGNLSTAKASVPLPGLVDVALSRQPEKAMIVRARRGSPAPGLEVQRWNLRTMRPDGSAFVIPSWDQWSKLFSPDGSILGLFTAQALGGRYRVLDASSGALLYEFAAATNTAMWACSGDGSLLAVAATNNVHLLEAATGRQRHVLPHGERVQSCTFSPDDRRLLVTCRDELIRPCAAYVWDVRQGMKVSPPLRHFDGIYSGSFSPDERRAVTTGEDYIAQLWDTRTWRCYARLGHESQVLSSAFSTDGTLVATGDAQQQVRIWDALTGESVAPPIWNYFNSWTVRILPGNEYLFGASRQGQTRIWHLAPSLPAPLDTADLALLSSLLSCHRSDSSGVAIPLGTAQIEAAWTNLSVKFPTLFSVSDQEIASWEARERALREKFAPTRSGH